MLRLRFYRNVKKWSTTKMNDKLCCLVYVFQPKNAITKKGLKIFVPADHRYDVCRCRHGLIALAPSFPLVAYQIFYKILSTISQSLGLNHFKPDWAKVVFLYLMVEEWLFFVSVPSQIGFFHLLK